MRNIAALFCINRNIVECKEDKENKDNSTSIVLIETSWNVKYQIVCSVSGQSRINRNIVECKEQQRTRTIAEQAKY